MRQSSSARYSPMTSLWPARRFASCSRLSSSQRSKSVMPHALLGDLVESAAVTVECGFLAGLLLPPQNSDVNVSRVDIQAVADAPGLVSGDQRTPRPEKRIVDNVATLGVV